MIDLLVICVVIWLRRTKLEVRAFRYFLREGYWDCNYCVINNVRQIQSNCTISEYQVHFSYMESVHQPKPSSPSVLSLVWICLLMKNQKMWGRLTRYLEVLSRSTERSIFHYSSCYHLVFGCSEGPHSPWQVQSRAVGRGGGWRWSPPHPCAGRAHCRASWSHLRLTCAKHPGSPRLVAGRQYLTDCRLARIYPTCACGQPSVRVLGSQLPGPPELLDYFGSSKDDCG